MRLDDLTALGRPIDPDYPTNRAIALVALTATVAAGIWALLSGVALPETASQAVRAGLTVFLAWAIGRELDPDHDLSAFVGVALALIGLTLLDAPSLFLDFWLLLSLRLVNRTSGLPAKPMDSMPSTW